MNPNKIKLDKLRMYVKPKYFVDKELGVKIHVSEGYQSDKSIPNVCLSKTQIID